jgi:hypothetical protein
VQAVFAAITLVAVAWVWRRGASPAVRNAVLASATLVAVPLALLYDLMLATVAACWLLRDREHDAPWEKTALATLYVVLFDSRHLSETTLLPVNTIAALGLFALAARRAWRELAPLRLAPPQPAATPTR